MRGLGDFQRKQMKNIDPQIAEFFGHHSLVSDVPKTINKLREVWPRLSSDEKKLFGPRYRR